MQGTDGMLKTCMLSTRINNMRQSQLSDSGQTFEHRVLDYIQKQTSGYIDKSKYWIIDYL